MTESAQQFIDAAEQSIQLSRQASLDVDKHIPAPDGLSYLPYQKVGIAYATSRKHCLIADEMGLGKTVQAIGVINADPNINSALIVVPASLKLNWLREFERWNARGLSAAIFDGNKQLPDTDIVIVNYEQVARRQRQKNVHAMLKSIFNESRRAKIKSPLATAPGQFRRNRWRGRGRGRGAKGGFCRAHRVLTGGANEPIMCLINKRQTSHPGPGAQGHR